MGAAVPGGEAAYAAASAPGESLFPGDFGGGFNELCHHAHDTREGWQSVGGAAGGVHHRRTYPALFAGFSCESSSASSHPEGEWITQDIRHMPAR